MDLQCNFGFGASGTGGGGGGGNAFIELSGSDGVLAAGAVEMIESLPFNSSSVENFITDTNHGTDVLSSDAAFANAIVIGDGLSADQAESVFVPNIRFGAVSADPLISNIGSDVEFYNDGTTTFDITNDGSRDYSLAFFGGGSGSAYMGFGASLTENGTSVQTQVDDFSVWHNDLHTFRLATIAGGLNANLAVGAMSSGGAQFDGSLYENSFILAGEGITMDQSDTLFTSEMRFTSGGGNTTVISDVSTPIGVSFDADGQGDIYISPDLGSLEAYMYFDDNGLFELFNGDVSGDGMQMNLDSEDGALSRFLISNYIGGVEQGNTFMTRNTATVGFTTNDFDSFGVSIASRNTNVMINRVNSVALGGDTLTVDQDDTAFVQELRFNSGINTTAITDVGSGAQIDIDAFGADNIDLTTDNAVYAEGFMSISNAQAWVGYDNVLGGFVAANGGQVFLETDLAQMRLGASDILASSKGAYQTQNADSMNMALVSRNTQIASNLFNNSIFLGGTDGTIRADNTAYANRFGINLDSSAFDTLIDTDTLTADRFVTYGDRDLDFTTAPAYTITNVITDRAFDANSTTLNEVADVLGTLIADLTTNGIVT